MSTTTLEVTGMTCQNCVRHVREALLHEPGVTSAEVSLEDKKAIVEHDGSVEPQKLIAAIQEEGYEAKAIA